MHKKVEGSYKEVHYKLTFSNNTYDREKKSMNHVKLSTFLQRMQNSVSETNYRNIDFHYITLTMVYVLKPPFGYINYKRVTVLPTLSSEHDRNTHAYHQLYLCYIVQLLFSSIERIRHIICMCLGNMMSFFVTLLVAVCKRPPLSICYFKRDAPNIPHTLT